MFFASSLIAAAVVTARLPDTYTLAFIVDDFSCYRYADNRFECRRGPVIKLCKWRYDGDLFCTPEFIPPSGEDQEI